MQSQNIRIS